MRFSIYEKIERHGLEAQRAARGIERRQRELASIRRELALVAFDLAFLKLERALARKYRPDQPRVPAGHLGGGRFTRDERLGGSTSTDNTGRTRVAQLESDRNKPVDLREEEAKGGHTISQHVGKTDDEMLRRAGREQSVGLGLGVGTYRQGSFATLEDANDLTNRTLEQNQAAVEEVATGKREERFLKQRFGYRTGREAIRLPQTGSVPVHAGNLRRGRPRSTRSHFAERLPGSHSLSSERLGKPRCIPRRNF